MENTAYETIYKEIVSDLTTELQSDTKFNADILSVKVKNAIREVKESRKYPTSYTDETIAKDLSRYYSNIRAIALYDYNQVGVEGQQAHNENGVSRTWVDRKKLFSGIIPLAKF